MEDYPCVGQQISRRTMPEGYLHLTCEQRCQIYALCKRPLASPHRAEDWRGSVDDSAASLFVTPGARLSLQASGREGLAETQGGLGQATQNDAGTWWS